MDLEELVGLETESPKTEHAIYELFKWSLILKGAVSVAEVIVGTTLFFIPAEFLIALVQSVSMALAGYTSNPISDRIVEELSHFESSTALFLALYLLSRGLIKCALIAGLLKNKLWAYPASLTVLGLFLIYQTYDIVTKGSVFVIAITIFDLIVMYLIWREYRIVRHYRNIDR